MYYLSNTLQKGEDPMFKSGIKSYAIMHGETKVASFRADGTCTIYRKSLLPYNLYIEETREETDIETRINNRTNFNYWCASRVLTLDRKYYKEIMNALGHTQAVTDADRAEIALTYHCLSLTDVYWVKEYREKISFEEINLYSNSLNNAFVDVSLKGKPLTITNEEIIHRDATGDIGTAGVAPKAWVRREKGFVLFKDGNPDEVEAELLASKIARCFDVDQVEYERDEYKGEAVSSCRLFTTPHRSIVTSEYVTIYALNHDKTLWDYVEKYDSYGFHMMNIIDYLVGNTDRHLANWGFLVDEKNRLVKLHPLMDFNKSFLAYDTVEGGRCLTTKEKMTQKEAALEAVGRIGLNQKTEISPDIFPDQSIFEMFSKRLAILKEAAEELTNRGNIH